MWVGINLVAAGVVAMFLLRNVVSTRQLVAALCALAASLGLLLTLLRSHDIETTSRQRLYADPIIAYRHTAYQEIVVTRRGADTRLYLDGGLQFSTRDEYRYTESLVYPALGNGAHSVLVLGGGEAKSSTIIDFEAAEPGDDHRSWTVTASIARPNAGAFIAADAICGVA